MEKRVVVCCERMWITRLKRGSLETLHQKQGWIITWQISGEARWRRKRVYEFLDVGFCIIMKNKQRKMVLLLLPIMRSWILNRSIRKRFI